MSRTWRRILKVLEQDSIRLPRCPPAVADIQVGDRIQIGSSLWWVRGRRPATGHGVWAFELVGATPATARARLAVPAVSTRSTTWILFTACERLEVSIESIVIFPSGGARAATEV